jgi:hypothetical protein
MRLLFDVADEIDKLDPYPQPGLYGFSVGDYVRRTVDEIMDRLIPS